MSENKFELPIKWNDYEDIAIELYEKFGDDFDESKSLARRQVKKTNGRYRKSLWLLQLKRW